MSFFARALSLTTDEMRRFQSSVNVFCKPISIFRTSTTLRIEHDLMRLSPYAKLSKISHKEFRRRRRSYRIVSATCQEHSSPTRRCHQHTAAQSQAQSSSSKAQAHRVFSKDVDLKSSELIARA